MVLIDVYGGASVEALEKKRLKLLKGLRDSVQKLKDTDGGGLPRQWLGVVAPFVSNFQPRISRLESAVSPALDELPPVMVNVVDGDEALALLGGLRHVAFAVDEAPRSE